PFKLHAHSNILGEKTFRLGSDHIFFVFAESVVRLQRYAAFITDTFALERYLDQWEYTVVSTMQIGNGSLGFFDHLPFEIAQFIVQRHHRVFADLHAHFNSFTRFKTSAACPRALTP